MTRGDLADVPRDAEYHAVQIRKLAAVPGKFIDNHPVHDLEAGKMDASRLVQHESRSKIVEPASQSPKQGVFAAFVAAVHHVEALLQCMFVHPPGLRGRILAIVIENGYVPTARTAQPASTAVCSP